jgi:hypothetical protein
MNGSVALGVNYYLRHSRTVAQIDEEQITVVAPPVHPPH